MKHFITPMMPKTRFTYDFGDDWEINVKLEKIIIDETLSKKDLPRVLKGKGYGIIEDCGEDTRSKIAGAVEDFCKKHDIKLTRKDVDDLVDDIKDVAPEV